MKGSLIDIIPSGDNDTDVSDTTVEGTPETPSNSIDYSSLKYVAFGDSITASYAREEKIASYADEVAKILGCKLLNEGAAGSTLAYYSERKCIANDVLEIAKTYPRFDIISVSGGSNDKVWVLPLGTIDDTTIDTIYGSLNVIAKTLTETYPDAFIFFITPIKNRYSEYINHAGYNLADISEAIKDVGEKYHIPVLDLYETSQFETAENGMNNENCDGTHPLKEFVSEYIGPQVANFVKDNYKQNQN